MRHIVSLLFCVLASTAFASEVLFCEGFEEGDTTRVSLDLQGESLVVTETMKNGKTTVATLPADAWTRKEIPISPIFVAYGRTLTLDEQGQWIIRFSCGETRLVTCVSAE